MRTGDANSPRALSTGSGMVGRREQWQAPMQMTEGSGSGSSDVNKQRA